jgi:hypothetical protein
MYKVITWDGSKDANGNRRVTVRMTDANGKTARKQAQCGYVHDYNMAVTLLPDIMAVAYPNNPMRQWFTADIPGHSGGFVVEVWPVVGG